MKRIMKIGANKEGRRCAILSFTVKGFRGAVTVSILTSWYSPEVQKEIDSMDGLTTLLYVPHATSVDYHSYLPLYSEQDAGKCRILSGGRCYCDGSGLLARDYLSILVTEGSNAVFEELESYYKNQLGQISLLKIFLKRSQILCKKTLSWIKSYFFVSSQNAKSS